MNLFLCSPKKKSLVVHFRVVVMVYCNEYLFEGKCVCRACTLYSAGSHPCAEYLISYRRNERKYPMINDRNYSKYLYYIHDPSSVHEGAYIVTRIFEFAGIQNVVVKPDILYIITYYVFI